MFCYIYPRTRCFVIVNGILTFYLFYSLSLFFLLLYRNTSGFSTLFGIQTILSLVFQWIYLKFYHLYVMNSKGNEYFFIPFLIITSSQITLTLITPFLTFQKVKQQDFTLFFLNDLPPLIKHCYYFLNLNCDLFRFSFRFNGSLFFHLEPYILLLESFSCFLKNLFFFQFFFFMEG